MCLAQEHNAEVPMRFKPVTPCSIVKHSTTEPLCSLSNLAFSQCIMIMRCIEVLNYEVHHATGHTYNINRQNVMSTDILDAH